MKTVLKMTESQLVQVECFVNKHKKFGDEFGLIGQVRLKENEIDVVLLTSEQFDQCNKLFKKIGAIK